VWVVSILGLFSSVCFLESHGDVMRSCMLVLVVLFVFLVGSVRFAFACGSSNGGSERAGGAGPGDTTCCVGDSCIQRGLVVGAAAEGLASGDLLRLVGRRPVVLRSRLCGGRASGVESRVWRLLSRQCFGPR